MRLVDLKDGKITYKGEEFKLKELEDSEIYEIKSEYKEHIREELYKSYSRFDSGYDLNVLIKERRTALELLDDENTFIDIEIKSEDKTLPSVSELLESHEFVYEGKDIKFLADEVSYLNGKLESYKIRNDNFEANESLKNTFDREGRLIRSSLNDGETEKIYAYDDEGRLKQIKSYFDDEFIYKVDYEYKDNNIREGVVEMNGDVILYRDCMNEDGKIELTIGIDVAMGTIFAIDLYEYLDNKDVIIDSIYVIPED